MKYSELREKVARGAKFSIDFKKRTLRMNGKLVDLKDVECVDDGDTDIMDTLHRLYENYKVSVPSERSESRHKNYFKALPYKTLSDENMLYGYHREEARFALEFCILKYIVDGKLKWKEGWGSWFYQDPKDKDFVILREWVEPQQKSKPLGS